MLDYTLNEIKKELKTKTTEELLEYCLLLTKFKKDNKEYVGYLLFDESDKHQFLQRVLAHIDHQFEEIQEQKQWFLVKKSWRKILRYIGKCAKFTKNKELEIQMLLHFVRHAQKSGVPYYAFNALSNIVDLQIKKIRTALPLLNADLQYDYERELQQLLELD